MADAYGTMVLTYSENIECDFDGLVDCGCKTQFKSQQHNGRGEIADNCGIYWLGDF